MHLHHEYDPAQPPSAIFASQQALAKEYVPILPDDRMLCSFLHIFSGGCWFFDRFSLTVNLKLP
jgi:Zn-dependent oligopeptidase